MASACVPAATAQRSGFLISGLQNRPGQPRTASSSAFRPLSWGPDRPTRFQAVDMTVLSRVDTVIVDTIKRCGIPFRQLPPISGVSRFFEIGAQDFFLETPPPFIFQQSVDEGALV